MERETLFADVILPLPVPGYYTYRVPFELNAFVKKGIRVVVQFGKQKLYTALIAKIHDNVPKKYEPKYILSILDEEPIVNNYQFKFWEWMSDYYICRMGEIMNAALPSALKLESESKIVLNPEFNEDYSNISDKEYLIVEALVLRKVISVTEASKILDRQKIIPVIKTLIEKGVALLEEELVDKYKVKTEIYVRLTEKYANDEEELKLAFDKLNKKAPKQLEMLMSFINLSFHKNEITRSELTMTLDKSAPHLASLVKKGILETYGKSISRLIDYESVTNSDSIVLSDDQQTALDSVNKEFETKNVVLLHGITSSGKTEIYIKIIDEVVKEGKQVLFLLPEIALTAQIINRLRKYFGSKVGIYHSKQPDKERVEIWNSILDRKTGITNEKDIQIILGARSAVFLPYTNLGLVIVDEEHDTSFKQNEPAPRYNGRDCAIFLAHMHGAKTLLGSATPSVESYFNAHSGKYGFVELLKRYGDISLPEILVADVKEDTKKKRMKSHFTPLLLESITEALLNGEQIILFQNRRGFSLYLECSNCNWVPQCRNCDVSLIYHKKQNQLRCHYCGYSVKIPEKCPACGSTAVLMKGFGTEKIEEELAVFFPNAVTARMDLDTTRTRNSYQKIINDFEDKKVDILVGTQMVTKGLDFDNVSVVGVLNADSILKFPDFRSFERGFQLLAQVSGRAGRKNKRGKVIIQSFDPFHSVIRYVIDNNYIEMYNSQLLERKSFKYPPFYRLINLTIKHRDENTLNSAASELARELRKIFPDKVLGPEFPFISRIKNLYLKNIILKLAKNLSTKETKAALIQITDKLINDEKYKGLRVSVDVDPM